MFLKVLFVIVEIKKGSRQIRDTQQKPDFESILV